MKFVTCEMQKVAFAALLLGVFTLNPMAHAQQAPAAPAAAAAEGDDLPAIGRESMRLSEIQSISQNFRIRLVGDQLVFSGGIPRVCAAGATASLQEVASASDSHGIRINFPGCQNITLTPAQRRDLVPANARLRPISLANAADGKICVVAAETGEELACDPLMNSGEQVEFITARTRRARAAAAAAAQQRSQETTVQQRRAQSLLTKVTQLCREGNWATIGTELEAARPWLGDMSEILDQLRTTERSALRTAVTRARTVEALNTAYENLLTASAENGGDNEEASQAYAERRIELLREQVSNRELSTTRVAAAIREYTSDLRNNDLLRGNQTQVAWAYAELAGRAREANNFEEAERFYTQAIDFSDNANKVRLESEMARMFREAAEACLQANRTSPARCDRLAAKSRGHMDRAIAAQGRIRGDDSIEALAGMRIERLRRFGQDGYYANHPVLGQVNMAGSEYDQRRIQLYQQGVQEAYMQAQMRQQLGAQGVPAAGAAANGAVGAGNYF